MKLSSLIKKLYEESEYTSVASLSDTLNMNKDFIDRAIQGRNTVKKLDLVFEELTKDIEVEDFITAIDLIREIKRKERFNKQIL